MPGLFIFGPDRQVSKLLKFQARPISLALNQPDFCYLFFKINNFTADH